jgi:hypothetical protein
MLRDSARDGEPELNTEHEEDAPAENGEATVFVEMMRHGKHPPLHSRETDAPSSAASGLARA